MNCQCNTEKRNARVQHLLCENGATQSLQLSASHLSQAENSLHKAFKNSSFLATKLSLEV